MFDCSRDADDSTMGDEIWHLSCMVHLDMVNSVRGNLTRYCLSSHGPMTPVSVSPELHWFLNPLWDIGGLHSEKFHSPLFLNEYRVLLSQVHLYVMFISSFFARTKWLPCDSGHSRFLPMEIFF
ncbi:hypothetical protein M758_3G001800 [Ceratodon purpureus]|nr:hypothetical protein M758_3G001800 [Ceratodon purpureus]